MITITCSVEEDGKLVSGANVLVERYELSDVVLLDAKLRNLLFVVKDKILKTM